MNEKEFIVSAIIPVYNAEKYLSEALDSIIGQTLGLENIQIILVNDESPDHSEELCLDYQRRYPENITYLRPGKNQGPAGARVSGIPYIRGKYVNFMDSDDKWELDAYEKAVAFLEEHEDEIDLVSCRIFDFDAWEAWHPLDHSFAGDRIVNILDDYTCIKTMITSCLIKSEVVRQIPMDCSLRYAEDTKYVTQVILQKGKYGQLKSAVFKYRRHPGEDSISQTIKGHPHYYTEATQKLHLELHEYSKKLFGAVTPFVQYIDAYYCQWRMRSKIPAEFSNDFINEYRDCICQVLAEVSDHIIWEQKNIWREDKLFLLSLKYGRDVRKELVRRENKLYFNNIQVVDLADRMNQELKIMHVNDGILHLEGQLNYPLPQETYSVFAEDNWGNRYPVEVFSLGGNKTVSAFGIDYHQFLGYRVDVPLAGVKTLRMCLSYDGCVVPQQLRFGKLVRLSHETPWSHHEEGGYSIRYRPPGSLLEIHPDDPDVVQFAEKKYLERLRKDKHRKVWVFRQLIARLKQRKEEKGTKIWLFTDRIATADDNGEFLLDYVSKLNDPKLKCYYVLSKDSVDYPRMKKKAHVVAYKSWKFYILMALCDKIITSIFDRYFFESFNVHHEYVKDMFHFHSVYLQHCVLIDDLSKAQNKLNEDMSLFITTAREEYEAMFEYPYCYGPDVVKLTGMPRYDVLEEAREQPRGKNILFAPTYRMYLNKKGGLNQQTGRWDHSDAYKGSEYFEFYNGLINDQRILDCMRKHGYTGTLRLHPAAMSQASDFQSNDVIRVHSGATNFRDQFKENCFVITDYSTTAVDYAYVGIPVVYAQFDVDTFYINHTYMPGFFDYEKHGFGPVCYDYESTVQAIIDVIERGCRVDPMYQERRNTFFTFHDGENCKRVYEEILKLDEASV